MVERLAHPAARRLRVDRWGRGRGRRRGGAAAPPARRRPGGRRGDLLPSCDCQSQCVTPTSRPRCRRRGGAPRRRHGEEPRSISTRWASSSRWAFFDHAKATNCSQSRSARAQVGAVAHAVDDGVEAELVPQSLRDSGAGECFRTATKTAPPATTFSRRRRRRGRPRRPATCPPPTTTGSGRRVVARRIRRINRWCPVKHHHHELRRQATTRSGSRGSAYFHYQKQKRLLRAALSEAPTSAASTPAFNNVGGKPKRMMD